MGALCFASSGGHTGSFWQTQPTERRRHFEVIGKDGERLQRYYSELFGWQIDADNPMNYGMVARERNVNADGAGIGGGVGPGPEGYEGHVTFNVEVPDVEEALSRAESRPSLG